MNYRIIVFAICVISITLFQPESRAAGWSYRVAAFSGDVKVIEKGMTRKVANDEALAAGSIVVTGSESFADIVVGDVGLIRVDERTRIALSSLVGQGTDETSDIDLVTGKIQAVFTKLARDARFEVKSMTQLASVRGTAFQVFAEGDESGVEVLSGEVMVHPVEDGRVIRGISERVKEGRVLRIKRSQVRDVIARRARLASQDMDEADLDRLTSRFERIRSTRRFETLNKGLRDEINKTIKRKKSGEGLKKSGKEQMKKKMERREKIMRRGSR